VLWAFGFGPRCVRQFLTLRHRHGWGCTPNPTEAVSYLTAAASNAASIESLALKAGMKKGGAAKGELVLAIFELANCFRHGWGVKVDKVAAKQVRHYEGIGSGGAWELGSLGAWGAFD
jgi:TPR repeat protein